MNSALFTALLDREPTRIVRPSSITEIAEIVAGAEARGEAVIPWGGGTGQAYGYPPRRADALLDLSGLNRVVAHEPGDLTVTVQAGATLDTVQSVLAERNQFLPLDPPDAARATMGGILATDAFGPSRPLWGAARDWLIGLTVVDAGGRIVKGGGKVVKNVTGYDIPKLHVGALGTLGVIVEATFKVAPRPETGRALMFALPASRDDSGCADFLRRVAYETAPALSLLRDMSGARIAAFLYAGIAEVTNSERDKALRMAEAGGIAAVTTAPAGMDRPFTDQPAPGDALIFRVTGPPDDEFARHAALAALFATVLYRLDTLPGCGQTEAVLVGDFDPLSAARLALDWAERIGAGIAFLQAPLTLRKADIPLWSPLPPSLPLMRRLKAALDPNGTLNPGRFIGRL